MQEPTVCVCGVMKLSYKGDNTPTTHPILTNKNINNRNNELKWVNILKYIVYNSQIISNIF